MPSIEDLYQYVYPDHAVDLVYEAVVVASPRHDIFLNLGWNVLVVNPSDCEERR
jgi:hypothetical protein